MAGPLAVPAFRRVWTAWTVSDAGSYVTVVAVQVLVVVTLHGSAADVGLVSGARWLAYLLFGLVAGVWIDRVRRRPVLIVSDLGRGAVLALVPLLAWLDALTVWSLAGLMVVFGAFSLVGDAAAQSFLPRLVPTRLITTANARLDQSDAVAQTAGPTLGGVLVAALSAPAAMLVDAISFVVSALLIATVRVEEPAPRREDREFRRELVQGMRWVYLNPRLAPLAVGTHGWFLFFSVYTAAFAPFALRSLGLSAVGLGLVVAASGLGSVVGSSLATRLGTRFGTGRVAIACWVVNGLSIAVVALARDGAVGAGVVAVGQLVLGLSMGAENANTLGYRQAITPDELQGRCNTTIRSVNRAMVVVGAPLGGLVADVIGLRVALLISAGGIVLVAAGLAASSFRTVRVPEPVAVRRSGS